MVVASIRYPLQMPQIMKGLSSLNLTVWYISQAEVGRRCELFGLPKSYSGNRLDRLCETTHEAQQNFTLYAWFRLDNSVNEEWCGKFLSTLRLQSRFFKTSPARASKQRPESRRTCLAFRHKSFVWINQTTRTNRAKSLRADLLWAVGGQHKNYPIINNIPEQRGQASLLGPSLHVDHLKRKSDFYHVPFICAWKGKKVRANTRSVNFLRSSCRNQFSFLV